MTLLDYRYTIEAMSPLEREQEIKSVRNSSSCKDEIAVRTAIILSCNNQTR